MKDQKQVQNITDQELIPLEIIRDIAMKITPDDLLAEDILRLIKILQKLERHEMLEKLERLERRKMLDELKELENLAKQSNCK